MQPVTSAGKHATSAKCGKTCNRCQVRENVQPVPSAGKHATGAKRGKTCNRCQVRKNMQPMSSARKHATGANCGKFHTDDVAFIIHGLNCVFDWLLLASVYSG